MILKSGNTWLKLGEFNFGSWLIVQIHDFLIEVGLVGKVVKYTQNGLWISETDSANSLNLNGLILQIVV